MVGWWLLPSYGDIMDRGYVMGYTAVDGDLLDSHRLSNKYRNVTKATNLGM
jgi:hypothetical protein